MTAIDNSGLKTFCNSCNVADFAPGVSFAINTEDGEITLTSTSVFPTGDSLAVVNVIVSDRFGGVKKGQITGAPLVFAINSFDLSEGLNIQATVVSAKRLIADLTAYGVTAATGVLGNADIETDEVTE